jgi:hypothetical protein
MGATAKNPLNLIRVMPAKGQECLLVPARPDINTTTRIRTDALLRCAAERA